ncbi:hypothetical protein Tco_1422774 [Tanacetum coccineum]
MSQFHLPYGIQVVELPEEIGRLECLKELDITGTGICHLPRTMNSTDNESRRLVYCIENFFYQVGGKHACVDLNRVSSLVGLSSRGFTVGQAALKAASCKVAKHEKTCIKNQHVFIPFAFDTFDLLAPEAVELLTRVQRVMNSNVMTPRFTNVVFNRIVFAIQKGLAAQLVARLPSPTIK